MSNQPIFVLAGSRDEYERYLYSIGVKRNSKTHVYIHDAVVLRGIMNPEVVRVGTWYEINSIKLEEIEMAIASRSFTK